MTESAFQEARAYLSHTVLRNELLCRLSSPPDLWSDPRRTVSERARMLTDNWQETVGKTDSVLLARRAWTQPSPHGEPPSVVRSLVRGARRFPGKKLGPAFPTDETVEKWLADIDRVVSKLGSCTASWPRAEVKSFWTSVLELTDFVAGLSKHAPRHSEYFQ